MCNLTAYLMLSESFNAIYYVPNKDDGQEMILDIYLSLLRIYFQECRKGIAFPARVCTG